jgi:hypothetical protein
MKQPRPKKELQELTLQLFKYYGLIYLLPLGVQDGGPNCMELI